MSIRLSDYAIDEEEWIATVDEESEWPPNPYQAQAEAQVRAGAWPGASLLIGARPFRGEASEPAPDDGPLWSMKPEKLAELGTLGGPRGGSDAGTAGELATGGEAAASSAVAADASTWSGSPWRFLFEFRNADRTTKQHSGADWDSTDEGDVDADLPETPGSTTEATEGDESGTPCSASQRSLRLQRKLSHQCVPRNTDLMQFARGGDLDANVTTLMIRNVPNLYTRSMLMEELDSLGFKLEFDFIYLPIDKVTQWNVGYAFVNFTSNEAARRCVDVMTNYTFCRFEHGSGKVAQVSIAHIQGFERNLQYYSNTAVQCARIQSHRPLVLTPKQQREAKASGAKQCRRRRRLRPPEHGALAPEPLALPLDPGLQGSTSSATVQEEEAAPREPGFQRPADKALSGYLVQMAGALGVPQEPVPREPGYQGSSLQSSAACGPA